jgi:hypothetical protein
LSGDRTEWPAWAWPSPRRGTFREIIIPTGRYVEMKNSRWHFFPLDPDMECSCYVVVAQHAIFAGRPVYRAVCGEEGIHRISVPQASVFNARPVHATASCYEGQSLLEWSVIAVSQRQLASVNGAARRNSFARPRHSCSQPISRMGYPLTGQEFCPANNFCHLERFSK